MATKFLRTAIAAAALALGTSAFAGLIDSNLTTGVLNTFEDQDREAYIDVDQDGKISIGDVFIGFVHIDNILPTGTDVSNQLYAVITNTITAGSAGGTIQSLGTTTTAGLTLQDLTGDALTSGGIFALYEISGGLSTDLIDGPPAANSTIFDYLNLIVAEGTLRLVGGFNDADNFITVTSAVGAAGALGADNSLFATTESSVTINNFTGGLSVLYEDLPGWEFDDSVTTFDAARGGLFSNQIGIANGAFRGMVGDGDEANWANLGATNFQQCTLDGEVTYCGGVTDADFLVRPNRVPEPASLALLGAGLLGAVGARRFGRKQQA